MSSNTFAAASTPFVQQSSPKNDLFQSFVQEPPQPANIPNFKPNFVPYTLGADLRPLAREVPAQCSGVDYRLSIGALDLRALGFDPFRIP